MPHDLVLEREVLGFFFCEGMATDPELIYSWASDNITEDDFYSEVHRTIFRACLALWKANEYPDSTNTAAKCEAMGIDKVDAAMAIADAWELVPTNDMGWFRTKVSHLKSLSQRRSAILAADLLKSHMQNPGDDSWEMVSRAKAALEEAEGKTVQKDAYLDSEAFLSRAFQVIEATHTGEKRTLPVPTGLIPVDQLIGGFYRGGYAVLAGRPSVGKSAFALQCALYAAQRRNRVCISSLEMSNTQLALRSLAHTARRNMQDFMRGPMPDEVIADAREAANQIWLLPIAFQDNKFMVEEILTGAREQKNRLGLDLLVVDYLQLARSKAKTERFEREIANISQQLKAFAVRENVAVVALSQFSRRMEEGQVVREPRLSDLRESGAIEQDADVVMALHRPDAKIAGEVKCLVLKNRQGPIGEIVLTFRPDIMTFEA